MVEGWEKSINTVLLSLCPFSLLEKKLQGPFLQELLGSEDMYAFRTDKDPDLLLFFKWLTTISHIIYWLVHHFLS